MKDRASTLDTHCTSDSETVSKANDALEMNGLDSLDDDVCRELLGSDACSPYRTPTSAHWLRPVRAADSCDRTRNAERGDGLAPALLLV